MSDIPVASDSADTTLFGALSASATTINVASAARFVANGIVTIDDEDINVCSIAGNSLIVCPGGRGYAGTAAAAHLSGARVTMRIKAWHWNQLRTILTDVGIFSKALAVVSATLSGALTAASVTVSAAVTGATGAFSGALTAASLAVSGAVTALSVAASGAQSTFTGAAGGPSARFSDGANSTVTFTHGASPIPNSAVLEGTGSTSITLQSSTGIVARVTGTARETIAQVTIPDGSTVSIGNLCAGGTYGSLKLIAVAANIFGEVLIQGGLNTAVQISDLGGSIATTDTVGQLCVLPAGGGAYTIKNRIGASVTLVIRFMGL